MADEKLVLSISPPKGEVTLNCFVKVLVFVKMLLGIN